MKFFYQDVNSVYIEYYKIEETGPGKGPSSAICLLYEKVEQHVCQRYRTHKGTYRYIKIDNTYIYRNPC